VICVAAPFGIAGRTNVQVAVSYQGNQGPGFPSAVGVASPGIFTADESGAGQASAFSLDPDGVFRANNTNHPIAPGGVLVLYLTGAGVMSPALRDGAVASTLSATPLLTVTAFIGAKSAEVLYSGSVPGLLAGVLQVNVRVPPNIQPGTQVPIVLLAGGQASQPGATITVQ
jgi:uncharacterized protein (TIGR03437 family)